MCDRLMTLPELCELLQCKESWAREQLEARRWPITWVAKSYRFSQEDYRMILRILAEPPAAEHGRQRTRPAPRPSGPNTKRPLRA